MYRRLTGQLYRAIQSNTNLFKGERNPLNCNLKEMQGFDFNSHSPFKEYFLPHISVTLNDQRQVALTIPEFKTKSQVVFQKPGTMPNY